MVKHFSLFALVSLLVLPCSSQQAAVSPAPSVAVAEASELPETPQPQRPLSEFPRLDKRLVLLGANARPEPADPALLSLVGTRVRLSLLSEVSSKLPSGSAFAARLEQPLLVNPQTVLPQGTIFEGRLETLRARRMMRRGAVRLRFERVLLPHGPVQPVVVSLVSTDSDSAQSSAEGVLRPVLSKKRLVLQLGGSLLAGKLADDLAEVASGSAFGAGTARYIGLGTAAAFLLMQKGREVKLHPGDSVEVEFGRSLVSAEGIEPSTY